jgi:hypothetical protein
LLGDGPAVFTSRIPFQPQEEVIRMHATYFPQIECLDERLVPSNAAAGLTQGNLIAALNNVAVQIDRVNVLNNVAIADVQVVNIQDVIKNSSVLNNVLRHADINVQVLQDFLNNSVNNNNVQVLNDVLNQNNVVVSDVIAVNVLSGGDIILFAQ